MERLAKLNADELRVYCYFNQNPSPIIEAAPHIIPYIGGTDADLGEIVAKLYTLKLVRFSGSDLVVIANEF